MDDMHREMMRWLRLYMLIGGMPQAVDAYLTTQDFWIVDDIKRSILDLYADDFAKIDISGRLSKIFHSIPAQLSQKSPNFKPYSVISRGVNKDAIEEALAELENSRTIIVAQMLRANGKELYYHTFRQPDDTKLYEVDFLFSHKDKLCPIEVKSAKYRAHTSIDLFCKKYSARVSEPYLIHTKDFDKEGNLRMIPTYATCLL